MLTQAEFESLLDRYLAGTSSLAETQLVERWYQQLEQHNQLVPDDAAQQALKLTLWARLVEHIRQTES
jgi:hypothetical protein